jgi:hypothetical protein
MRILTFFLALCLLAFNVQAQQCVPFLSIRDCNTQLTATRLTTPGNTVLGNTVSVRNSANVEIYNGLLPYSLPTGFGSYSILFSSVNTTTNAVSQCNPFVSVQTPFGCNSPAPTITAPTAGAVLDNRCTNGFNPTEWIFSWTAVTAQFLIDYRVEILNSTGTVLFTNFTANTSSTFISNLPLPLGPYQVVVTPRFSDGSFGTPSAAVNFSAEPENTDCPFVITSPTEGAVLDNACSDVANIRQWTFTWGSGGNPLNQAYNILITGPDATGIVANTIVFGNSYTFTSNEYVRDDRLSPWQVKVRPYNFNTDTYGAYTPAVSFTVEPIDTDCPSSTPPSITSPTTGELMDNACPADGEQTIWNFAWTVVNNNFQPYNLVVERPGQPPLIDVLVTGNDYRYVSNTAITGTGWQVKVRRQHVDGAHYSPFSTPVPFDVEPVNTDCNACATPTVAPTFTMSDIGETIVTWPAVAGAIGYILDYSGTTPLGSTYNGTLMPTTNTVTTSLALGTVNRFTYRVKCTPTTTSLPSPVGIPALPCDPPTINTITRNATNNNVTITWGPVAGVSAESYIVEYGIVGGLDLQSITTPNAFVNQAVIPALPGGLEYRFRVYTKCYFTGPSSPSPERTLFVPLLPPSPTITSPLENAIMDNGCQSGKNPREWSFSWTPINNNALPYHLVVQKVGVAVPVIDVVVNSNTYTSSQGGFIANANATGWQVRVQARLADGTYGPYSAPVTFSVEPVDTDCPCTNPTVAPTLSYVESTNTVNITGGNIGLNSGYQYEYRISGSGAAFTTISTGSVNISLTNTLNRGVSYEVRYRFRCSSGALSNPTPSSFISIPCNPPTITDVTYNAANNEVALTWTPISGVAYLVEYRPSSSTGAWQSVEMRFDPPTNGAPNSTILSNLTRGEDYTFRVKTICAPGQTVTTNSVPSAERTLSIPLPVPAITSPASAAVLDNGCLLANGIAWDFAWTDVKSNTNQSYNLQILRSGSVVHDLTTPSNTYNFTLNNYYADNSLTDWSARVRIVKPDGTFGGWSAPVPFTLEPLNTDCPLPPAPTITAPIANAVLDNACPFESNQTIWNFSWTSVNNDAQPYNLVVDIDGTNHINVLVTGNTYTYTSNLNLATTGWQVKVRARALDDANFGPFSAAVPFSVEPANTDCTPCPTPTTIPTISVFNATTNITTVTWSAATEAIGYILQYGIVGGTLIELPTTANTVNLNLVRGATYQFRYRLKCTDIVFSGYSPTRTFGAPCSSPTIGSLTHSGATNIVTIAWLPLSNTSGFRVEYRPVGSTGTWEFVNVPSTANSTTISTLSRGVNYRFRVSTVCSSGNTVVLSAPSAERGLFVPCPTPTDLTVAYNPANNSATLSWMALLSNAAGFAVEYRPVGSTGAWQSVSTEGTTTTATVTNLTRGQNFEFRVSTQCSSSSRSLPSTTKNLLVPCPSLTTAPRVEFNSANNSAVLNWAAVDGVAQYKVEFRALVFNEQWQSITTTTNSAIVPGIVGGLQYQFRVTTVCPALNGEPLSSIDLTVPCGVITGLFVTDLTMNSAVLSWDAANGADSYEIFSEEGLVATVAGSPFVLKGLLPDNDYIFTIIPKCRISDAGATTVRFTTPPSPTPLPCNAPNVRISNVKSTTALAQWNPVPNARRYIVSYKLSSATAWRSATTSATSIQLEGLTPRDLGDHTYEVRVQSVCTNTSTSDPSVSAEFETKSSCPEIDALRVGYRTHSLAVASWDAISEATGYTVEYYPLPFNTATARTVNVTTNAVTIEGLMPETEYGVRVKSLCDPKTSLFSAQATFRTTPVACPSPNKIKTSNVTTNSATVSWSNITLATGYEFAYKKASATNWTTVTTVSHFTTLSGLSPATTYDMRVRSLCAFNIQSAWSDIRSFETVTPTQAIISANNKNNIGNNAVKQADAALFDVSISPNPTTGLVTLDIESAQAQTLDISVVNRLGQVVLQKKMDAIAKGYSTFNLDLSALPNDVYILRTFNGQTFKTDKVVLEH